LHYVLVTHHHSDHCGGCVQLAQETGAQVLAHGMATHRIPVPLSLCRVTCVLQSRSLIFSLSSSVLRAAHQGVTHAVSAGERVVWRRSGLSFDVLHVPGHTSDHIAFVMQPQAQAPPHAAPAAPAAHAAPPHAPVLFCGDTLFSLGCGRLFEGSAEQMWQSLSALARLPPHTLVCPGTPPHSPPALPLPCPALPCPALPFSLHVFVMGWVGWLVGCRS
jgi:hydroxyacylglutathione hydrolase